MFAKVNETPIVSQLSSRPGSGVTATIMPSTKRNFAGSRSVLRHWLPLAMGMLTGIGVSAGTPFSPEGAQYQAAGAAVGDQISPALVFRSSGGWLAWQDNSTDGVGFGISARRLTGQLTGLSSFRVNETTAGDQENAQIALLPDGGAFIVWQSGTKGAQSIMGRMVKPDGKFAGGEFLISGANTKDNREPSIAINKDGTILVVWASDSGDGTMLGVQGRLYTATGTSVGDAISLNQFSKFHQRSPAVASLSDGNFAVVWISEHQRSENSVDVYARRVTAAGTPLQDEFIVNVTSKPCATPTVAPLTGGGFMTAWAEHDFTVPGTVWDVVGRVYSPSGPLASPASINTRRLGFQGMPKLAPTADCVLVVYPSQGGDGYGWGVSGQWLSPTGAPLGDEFVVNTQTSGDQLTPTVATDGDNRIVALWSTFGGSLRGMDLAGQRFTRAATPLEAPSAPYVFAVSSSRLLITFPELSGLPVKQYELYINGSETPVVVTSGSYTLEGLAPNSSQVLRLAYQLQDGRRSPLSLPSSGQTWGEDRNEDDLPDDWQIIAYGSDSTKWPLPSTDTDQDGATDREEYLAGTDPKSAQSVLRTTLTSSQQGVLLSWNSLPGAFYQVQSSSNLKDWINVGAARLAAGETDSIPIGDQPNNSYYRVNLLR